MIALLHVLQIIAGVIWLLPLGLNAPAVWRLVTSKADAMDAMRAPIFFVSAYIVMSQVRWLLWSDAILAMTRDEIAFWMGVYIIGIGSALGMAWSLRFSERFR